MRRVILAFAGTVTALVMLLGLKANFATPVTSPITVVATGSSPSADTGTPSSGSRNTSPVTVTGDSVSTPYGPVQVKVTVAASKIKSVSTLRYPSSDSTSQQISEYAVPRLTQEAIAAGSANIDMVSGASYTSNGYIQSLQSALDQVG